MSTLRITNIEAKADASSPSVNEKIKVVSSTGTTLLQVDGATSGVSTVTVGTGVTIQGDSGIITATKFSGNFSGNVTGNVTGNLSGDIVGTRTLGTGVTVTAAGIVSATQYYGSAEKLTSIPGDKITAGIPGANITGTIPSAALGTVGTDIASIRKDIALLALHTAIDNNKTAHSLENTFIEQFEDSSKITLTNAGRSVANEYISTVNPNLTYITEGFAGGINMLGDANQAGATSYTGYDGITRAYGQMTGNWENYEAFNLKHIFAANEDFEVIVSVRGTYQSVGYLHGSITDLSALNYISTGSFWGNSSSSAFDSHPGTYYGKYHAPFHGDGASNWYNLYRWSRVSNNFTLQWLGRTTTAITINDTNITALRTSSAAASGDVESIGADRTLASAMVVGWGEAGSDTNRFMKIELATRGTPSTTATGTCESAAITASDARTKVSGVILYKDAEGTATLGTDLKVSFSCDNGSNYTTLDSTAGNYTAGVDFSTGIKTAYVKEVTCTSGTQIKYKVEWANQAEGTKETQLHSISLNY